MGEEYLQWRKEFKYMKKKWGNLLNSDPFYSPYLSREQEDWSITISDSDLFIR